MIRSIRSALLFAAFVLGVVLPAANAGEGARERHRGRELGEFSECLAGRLERAERNASGAGPALDDATGRDLRHFPPDRHVDFQHMKLQMRFDDLNEQKFTAIESLSFVAVGRETVSLKLDAIGLKINSVQLDGKAVEFAQDDEHLMLRFDPPLPAGEKRELVIEYACDHPRDGMFFTPAPPDSPNAPHYTAEVHTQGQSETNRHWFVSHDFPNERMSTELIVDVPTGFSVSSNGKLVSNLTSGDRSIWHYLQEKPHVSYLVTLVIGKFDIVEVPHARVPMRVWVAEGEGADVERTYGRTGAMIDLFEQRLGVAYPWARYDQLCVKNFGSGGMENTSATTMYRTALLDETALLDGDLDGLISHELCHMWTGDLITCKSWAHIWLNEGWATYGEALWFEQRDGEDGYFDTIRGEFGVARADKTTGELPMVSPIYATADDVFGRTANPYPKGASILHMLRMMLGEEAFWKGVHTYMNRHALGLVETSDFRYAMEEASGLGLEGFFEQWCYRPGTPELGVKVNYDGETRELNVTIEQKQKIDERTPAFQFTLPIFARTAQGDRTFDVEVREKTTVFRTTLDGPPSMVVIDPRLHVLKTMEVEKPLAMWMEQARLPQLGATVAPSRDREGAGAEDGAVAGQGLTIAARHEAVEALAKFDLGGTIELLARIIRNDKERHTLRNTAVDSLAKLGAAEAKARLIEILKEGVAEARVRARLVSKLRDYPKAEAIEIAARLAENDASYATRVEAIQILAHHKAAEKADLIAGLVEFESRSDQVRNAALRALAALDDPRGLDLGIKYAAYGYYDRSRPTAIETIGKLAKHDEDRAIEFLLGLLNDPESRTVTAAGAALAEVGDKRALATIRAMSESHRDPSMRERAKGWLKRIEEAKQPV